MIQLIVFNGFRIINHNILSAFAQNRAPSFIESLSIIRERILDAASSLHMEIDSSSKTPRSSGSGEISDDGDDDEEEEESPLGGEITILDRNLVIDLSEETPSTAEHSEKEKKEKVKKEKKEKKSKEDRGRSRDRKSSTKARKRKSSDDSTMSTPEKRHSSRDSSSEQLLYDAQSMGNDFVSTIGLGSRYKIPRRTSSEREEQSPPTHGLDDESVLKNAGGAILRRSLFVHLIIFILIILLFSGED